MLWVLLSGSSSMYAASGYFFRISVSASRTCQPAANGTKEKTQQPSHKRSTNESSGDGVGGGQGGARNRQYVSHLGMVETAGGELPVPAANSSRATACLAGGGRAVGNTYRYAETKCTSWDTSSEA